MQLRETIAWKLTTQNQIPTKASEVLVTVGLSEAIFDLLCTILDDGDEILVPDPVWMNYVNVPRLLGAVPVSYKLREENCNSEQSDRKCSFRGSSHRTCKTRC